MSVAYAYRARDRTGAMRKGVVRAATPTEAYRRVVALGLFPVKIRTKRTGARPNLGRPAASTLELSEFTHELAVLLEAGVAVSEGLRSIGEQTRSERFRAVVRDAAARIQAGESISGALGAHATVFGEIYVETIRAAERSGNMVEVLRALADMLEQHAEQRRQVRKAMAYPVMVVIALSLAIGFLLAFVVPRFGEMFAKRGMDLPLLTQALQAAGLFLRNQWWLVLGGLAASVWGVRRAWRTAAGRRVLDRSLHMIPAVSRVLVGGATARFTRVFGLCVSSGLPLTESLELAGRASGRPSLEADAHRLIRAVDQGRRLSHELGECRYLPHFARRMIAAGEESATLSRMCDVISRHYDRETAHTASTLSTVIEPILIVLLTGVVLLVALAIFLPMWDMAGLVG